MRRATILVAVVLLGTGCGTVPGTGSDAKLKAAVETFIDVCTGDDPAAALDVLTDPAHTRFLEAGGPIQGCREILALKLPRSAPEARVRSVLETATLGDESVSGDFATAVLETRGGGRSRVEFENIGGRWRLARPEPGP